MCKFFLLTKKHCCQQQIMADPTSSYVKKLKDGAVNQVGKDMWSDMVVIEQQEKG